MDGSPDVEVDGGGKRGKLRRADHEMNSYLQREQWNLQRKDTLKVAVVIVPA